MLFILFMNKLKFDATTTESNYNERFHRGHSKANYAT